MIDLFPITRFSSRHVRASRGFTLVELLVVMAVIAILAILTVISIQGVATNAKLSRGVNIVTSSLSNARALAMKNNQPTLVFFRPRWNPQEPSVRQVTEVIIARWTGESVLFDPADGDLADVFEPVPNVAIRELPAGIKVAGPFYEIDAQESWLTQGQLPRVCDEYLLVSQLIGVMFGPDGALLTRNPNAGGADHKTFVDFCPGDCDGDADPQDVYSSDGCSGNTLDFWWLDDPRDETNINLMPFLAVYNDDEARERGDVSNWNTENGIADDLTGPADDPDNLAYISRFGERITFNRYSGVVMK